MLKIMSTKRYTDLTVSEKLSLDSSDGFINAVKIEAIQRGIKIPTTLSQAINSFPLTGFSIPPDAVMLYEICAPSSYGEPKKTGVAFKTRDEAVRALQGAIPVYEDGYGATAQMKIGDSSKFEIREAYITFVKPASIVFSLEQLNEDTTAYDALLEECRKDLEAIRQNEYNKRVLQQKRAQYLDLAKGDESIARAFWAKVEGGEFPSKEDSFNN